MRGEVAGDRVSDLELVARSLDGDTDAYAALFRSHRDMVYGLARRLTDDADLAEEVVLEAFTAAWSNLSSFRGDSRFSTWLCAIALNTAREKLRSRTSRQGRLAALVPDDPRHARNPPRLEDSVDLERAIASLPDRAREALVLRHVHGLSCREAATAMGVSAGTIKSQTARACRLLRERLDHD